MRRLARFVPLAVLALPGCPRPGESPPPKDAVHLTIVGTNDIHGWIDARQVPLADGSVLRSGGAALFAGALEALRAHNPDGVILLDAGDMFQGTLISNLSEGQAVIAAFNLLGYDAVAVGNHEFDYGPVGPVSVALKPEEDPLGALAERVHQARFPFLSRNVYDGKTGERLKLFGNDGVHLVTRNGVKVGIVGLVTPTTPTVTNPVNVQGLKFADLVPDSASGAALARERGAQVVILAVHAGGHCQRFGVPYGPESCDPSGEVFRLIEALPEGTFDVVVAGHVHSAIAHRVRGAAVIEANSYGRAFGIVDLYIPRGATRPDPAYTRVEGPVSVCERVIEGTGICDERAEKRGVRLLPAVLRGMPVRFSSPMEAVIAPYRARVAEVQGQPLRVNVPEPLSRERHAESLLGNALADALKAMEGADLAILNSGGLRADLPAGELTYGALYEVMPFDNALSTLRVTGAELTALLRAAYGGTHGAMQVSGLKVRVERCGGKLLRLSVTRADGRRLDPEATYTLVTSDFLALGGDDLGEVVNALPRDRVDLGHARPMNLRDALADYLKKRVGTLTAKLDGRLTVVSLPAAKCRGEAGGAATARKPAEAGDPSEGETR